MKTMDKCTVREIEEKNSKDRKINLLLLIKNYLLDEGYLETAKNLESESRLPRNYVLCDNVDLGTVLMDYESYYFARFHKYPKMNKKLGNESGKLETKNKRKEPIKTLTPKGAGDGGSVPAQSELPTVAPAADFLTVSPLSQPEVEKLWKGLGTFHGYSDEWKAFADIISKEVIDRDLNVKWDDVIGLETAKRLMKEAMVYPIKYPELFNGIISPWKGLLLYGPSGTGKTMLAKAVATECKSTFFNISASSLVSKWRGESEKLVRVMFELARHQAPSTIFIDEVDALASRRDCPTEHEASRRLKTELLVQMDGLVQSKDNILILTTSNLPWDLDSAILRRLEKRILVDLPDEGARCQLFKKHLPQRINRYVSSDVNYLKLAQASEGYSGSDIKLVSKEAIMEGIRPFFSILDAARGHQPDPYGKLSSSVIKTENVLSALSRTKPTETNTKQFISWQTTYEST